MICIYLLWFHVKKATNNWYATISILEKQSKHRATSVNVLLVEKDWTMEGIITT